MNSHNDFEPIGNEREEENVQAIENEEISAPQEAPETPSAEPQWYSVSYQNAEPPARKRRGRKVAVIALIVAVCLIWSVGACFGGALLSRFLSRYDTTVEAQSPASDNGGVIDKQSGTSSGTSTVTYSYTDTSYDFASVYTELEKNNDATLLTSENGSAGSNAKSVIEVTAAVKDSVVEITATTVSNRGTISAGAGSGVIIHEDGIIVTNNHVIADSNRIYVRLTNGDTYEASLRGTDETGDIAILKITPQEGKPLTVAKLGYSRALLLGEEVIAIGNPLGELGGTVTNGIISATAREVSVDGTTMTLLQTNAAINAGNSGGGLFNMAGELIGIVNAKYSATGVEGLGFAIPIDTAYESSFGDLLQYGYIRGIPSLGVQLTDYTGSFGTIYGARVMDVGTQTNFKVGDYIYEVDGEQVYAISTSAVAAIRAIVRAHSVGDEISVKVLRGNSTYVTFTVTLQEYIPSGTGLNIQ